jgi:hypothetical protein
MNSVGYPNPVENSTIVPNWVKTPVHPNPVENSKKKTTAKNRKNSNASQNNPTNIIHNSNRRNSTVSDPGRTFNVTGSKNWLKARPNTKNTTLKNIRNRIKAKNTVALTRFLNQKPKPSPPLPKINTPKMASRNQPYLFRKAKNWYNSTKFSFQKKQYEAAGMKLLNEERFPKTNRLHPSYNDNNDPNLNRINAEYTQSPSTRPGAGFVY